MTQIKLPRLPDRTPVKLTISLPPELQQALTDYAQVYRETYSDEQTIADLIPHMLSAFLASDRAFVKAREALATVS